MRLQQHLRLRQRLCHAVLLCCAGLTACAPGLNWREVTLGRLSALLPCKPDTATRVVQLGGQPVAMDVAGCEVGDALFAISRVQAPDAGQAPALLAALRQASLDTVRMREVHPAPNSGNAQTSFDVRVDARRADGTALQVRFRWLLSGTEVYQLAVYAPQLRTEQTEPLLSEARIR